jgi:apolipoprotein N-acyltransferase
MVYTEAVMPMVHPELHRFEEQGLRSIPQYLLMLASTGVLLWASYPWPAVAPLAHFALAPAAVAALRAHHPRRLLWTAWLVFFAWWLVMAGWIIPVTFGGYLGLCALMAVYPTLGLLLLRWFHQRYRSAMVLTLPMVWVALEMVRSQFLAGGFGWFTLAQTQAGFLPELTPGVLLQSADIFGEYGLSFLVGMSNGLVTDLCIRSWRKPARAGRLRWSRTLRVGLLIWGATYLAAWSYGTWRIGRWDAITRPGPVVAVIQTNVAQDNRNAPTREQEQADWNDLLHLSRTAVNTAAMPVEMVVWPETVAPALNEDALAGLDSSRAAAADIAQLARDRGVHLVVGSLALMDWQPRTDPATGEQYFVPNRKHNSVYFFYPDGIASVARYDKVHRVPFGEFIPWVEDWPLVKDWFIRVFSPYDFDYTVQRGAGVLRFDMPYRVKSSQSSQSSPAQGSGHETRLVRFATPICFEDTVGRLDRAMVYDDQGRKQADLLVNLTNDGWFAGWAQGPQHVQLAAIRCVENRVPMARAVNTGISGFIDSLGRVGPLVEADGQLQQVAGSAVERVRLDPTVTLFGAVGRWPVTLMAAFTALMAAAGVLRRRKA